MKNNVENYTEIDWIYTIKEKIPLFLERIKWKRRIGFYKFSLSGDYFGENVKWGLGNTIFFLKILYTLGLDNKYLEEIENAIKFILSFQKKDGSFYDPLIKILSLINYNITTFKTHKRFSLNYEANKRAETRQALSVLSLFNAKPKYDYKTFPKTTRKIEIYLNRLNWNLPWHAGSHFSHLLFFIQQSDLKNKDDLINHAIKWITKLQHEEDGYWYSGTTSIQQKINGAMKVITGLNVANQIRFKYPKRMIDTILESNYCQQACDNFNILYVLKYCYEFTTGKYRSPEVEKFTKDTLSIYKKHYHIKLGAFSFYINKANNIYYGAYITKGKNEPDIHGTHLFLWGISLIAQILKINDKVRFKEIIP